MKFTLYKDHSNQWRWRLQANNNRIIADSGEGYINKGDARAGAELVKKNAAAAPIEEQNDE